jgi:phosphoribosylanthranilate isomerase
MTRVKICGLTNLDDALAACDAGADALGFVFAESPRRVTSEVAATIIASLPPFMCSVGIFVDEDVEKVKSVVQRCHLDVVQLHGNETHEHVEHVGVKCIKSFRVRDNSFINQLSKSGADTFLLDTFVPDTLGGSGKTFDWSLAREAKQYGNIILAGGLTPENVAQALSIVQPYAVDVSSGVEERPGKKDHRKVQQFIEEVRAWDYRTNAVTLAGSADDLFLKR